MNEFAKPGLANDQFPPVSATDNGKVLTVADGKWAVGNASGGTTVVANPTLAGTEADLTGLQVGDTKYKVPAGGGGGVLVVHAEDNEAGTASVLDKTWQEIKDASANSVVVLELEDGMLLYLSLCIHLPAFGGSWRVRFFAGSESYNYETTEGANAYPEMQYEDPEP